MARRKKYRRRKRRSNSGGGIDDLSPEALLTIALVLAYVMFIPKILSFWNQYKTLIIGSGLFILGLAVYILFGVILPKRGKEKHERKKDEELEKRIIRKKLEVSKSKNLEGLDGEEREYLLNKWIEEEYKKSILGRGIINSNSYSKDFEIVTPLKEHERNKLINAVGNECEYPECNRKHGLQVHHIKPRTNGGTNILSNLIVLCPNHHDDADRGKWNQGLLREWIKTPKFGQPQKRYRFKYALYTDWDY